MVEARKVKIITTGPILGSFQALHTRLQNLQSSKAGPFDVCFCTGPFFARSASIHETEVLMKHGMPIPVYFSHIGDLPQGLTVKDNQWPLSLSTPEDSEKGFYSLATNVFHLCGKIGNKNTTQSADIINVHIDPTFYMIVGFLPPNVRAGTDQSAPFEDKTGHPSYIGCDVLLSSDWGQGMAKSPAISDQDKGIILGSMNGDSDASRILSDLGSFDVAELVSKARPRYHYSPTICVGLEKDHSVSDSLFFIQSLPYMNPPSAAASGIRKQYHVSRFLALCPLIADKKEGGANGRVYKSMHALGLQPLWSMDISTAHASPEGPTCQSPYTDLAYSNDRLAGEALGDNHVTTSLGLSEAQARRILSEDANRATTTSGEQQYRWNTRISGKRPFNETQSDVTVVNPMNCSLFLHGIHGESLSGSPLTEDEITEFFKPFHCVRVRLPTGGYVGKPKTYCFLDFSSHDNAKKYLESTAGAVSVLGVELTLNWSTGKPVKPPPPPPPPGLVGIYPGPNTHPEGYPPPPTLPFPKQYKRPRLSEADAADSETLFAFFPFKPASSSDDYLRLLQSLSSASQLLMENAMNDVDSAINNTNKITAETEPALRVTPRYPSANNNYGFLDFASHAAASVVLATLTGSIEGGDLLVDEIKLEGSSIEDFHGVQLWWAMSKHKENEPKPDDRARHNFQSHHYPLDARTDCWFCLASPTCEPHLILSVYDTCYITMPKGPIDDYHALIVPVNHMGNRGPEEEGKIVEYSEEERRQHYFNKLGVYTNTNPLVIQETEAAKEKLSRHTNDVLGKDIFFFERAFPTYRGYHAHINCVPIQRGTGASVINTMFELAKQSSDRFVFDEISVSVNEVLQKLRSNGDMIRGYFYAEVVNDKKQSKCFLFVDIDKDDGTMAEMCTSTGDNDPALMESVSDMTPVKRRIPLQFGRQVLAKILGDSSLAYWKHCVFSKEKEEQLTNCFRQTLLNME